MPRDAEWYRGSLAYQLAFYLNEAILLLKCQRQILSLEFRRLATMYNLHHTHTTQSKTPTQPSPSSPLKRKQPTAGDENVDPVPKRSATEKNHHPGGGNKAYTPRRDPNDKLCIIFDALKSVNWTLGDLFYYLFRLEDQDGQPIRRSQKHGSYIHQLLNGTSGLGVGYILDTWMRNTDGVAGPGSEGGELLYNMTEHYRQIRPARPALTSFAAQVVMNKLVREAEDVIHPNSGLHTSHGSQLCWADLSSTTVASVTDIIQKHQPLTWQYVTTICGWPPRKWNGVTALRKYRPVTGVSY